MIFWVAFTNPVRLRSEGQDSKRITFVHLAMCKTGHIKSLKGLPSRDKVVDFCRA